MKKLVPKWLAQFTPEGISLDDANVPVFFLNHPVIKLHYITNGECTTEQIEDLIHKCGGIFTRHKITLCCC